MILKEELKERDEQDNADDLNVLLEQYKLYVNMADNISSRRDKINKFYTSVITVILTFATFLLNEQFTAFELNELTLLSISFLGIGLCINWFISIESYKQLNSAKFKVINKLEEKLPFKGYIIEDEILKSKKRYNRLTKNEKRVPILLSVLFTFLFLYSLHLLLCNSG